MRTPRFIHLAGNPNKQSIRLFLSELVEIGVSKSTGALFASLAVVTPAVRLADNLARELAILSQFPVRKIVVDGLMDCETAALLELEDIGASDGALATAHGLLNLRERHFLAKSMRGFFSKHRADTSGYLDIEQESSL